MKCLIVCLLLLTTVFLVGEAKKHHKKRPVHEEGKHEHESQSHLSKKHPVKQGKTGEHERSLYTPHELGRDIHIEMPPPENPYREHLKGGNHQNTEHDEFELEEVHKNSKRRNYKYLSGNQVKGDYRRVPLPSVVISDRSSHSPFIQMGCPNWEADCLHSYDNGTSLLCKKMIPICTYGYFRSKDGLSCIEEKYLQQECHPSPNDAKSCSVNETYNQCPSCPDANCDIISCPVNNECDLTESCKMEEPKSNYCRLIPRCQCKPGYVRRSNKAKSKCVLVEECFKPRCDQPNTYYDRCPDCEDFKCSTGYFPQPRTRSSVCLKAACKCKEGFARDDSDNCVPTTQCNSVKQKNCGQNEQYIACPKCDDIECSMLAAHSEGRRHTEDSDGHGTKGRDYCGPPGCKCKEGFIRLGSGKNQCIPLRECPNVPKDYALNARAGGCFG